MLTTHLTEILKENMADLLSYAEVQKLLKDLPAEQKKLVDDLIPAVVTAATLQRVLAKVFRRLYRLKFPIRHMRLGHMHGPSGPTRRTATSRARSDAGSRCRHRASAEPPAAASRTTPTVSRSTLNPVENPYVGCGMSATRRPGGSWTALACARAW